MTICICIYIYIHVYILNVSITYEKMYFYFDVANSLCIVLYCIGYDIYYWVTEVLCNQSLNKVACYVKVYISVAECITSIFKKLEQKHGKILVQRALGYLSLSKNGLSETEMEDLLSLDDHVNI